MSTVRRQDSFDSLDSHDSSSLDSYVSDDLLEAPTLSSKEIQLAREQALKALETAPSAGPDEVIRKPFSEGPQVEPDVSRQLRNTVEAAATKPPKTTADGKPGVVGVMQPPPKS